MADSIIDALEFTDACKHCGVPIGWFSSKAGSTPGDGSGSWYDESEGNVCENGTPHAPDALARAALERETAKVAPDEALKQIAKLMSSTEWDGDLMNLIADIVTTAGYELAPDPLKDQEQEVARVKCPKCGCDDIDDLKVVETYTAYHRVCAGTVLSGCAIVENALGMPSPSLAFDDGAGDYQGHCQKCGHTDTTEAFGLGDGSGWEWV